MTALLDMIARCDPSQSHHELAFVVRLLEDRRIRVVVEIGVHRGGSLRVWRAAFKPNVIVGVDWHDLLGDDRRGFTLIEGDSQLPETAHRVAEALGGRWADLLFIDADHRRAWVERDFARYRALVRPGGAVVFHDVVSEPGVRMTWERYKHVGRGYVEMWDGDLGTGTGVLFV